MKTTAQTREERAYDLSLIYSQRAGVSQINQDSDGLILNLLTDLRHLCDTYNVNFQNQVEQSREQYESEVQS